MAGYTNKILMALLLGGAFGFTVPAIAQTADDGDAPAAALPAESASPVASEQPTEAVPPKRGQGSKAEAKHSAAATAHKSLNDPNNQLGTSLQGRTRPIAGAADPASPTDVAAAAQPSR